MHMYILSRVHGYMCVFVRARARAPTDHAYAYASSYSYTTTTSVISVLLHETKGAA